MTKAMIIGAYGKMAQLLTERLLNETDYELVLFLRNAARLDRYSGNQRIELVDGDVLDVEKLTSAMKSVDIVYSNLGGTNLADQIQSVIEAMHESKQERLVYISSLGAHHEVPGKYGEWNEQAIGAYLPGFRKAAELVSASGLKYTEIRPAWLTDNDEIDYEMTQVDEPFKGTEVSRASVADFAFQVVTHPETYVNASIGLNKPNTDGDRPSWM
ncbi:NAD(P)H-binding protein [Pediococcus pentosaceus]|jgi:uncharacterized protein YbjT (DUF2867 family)|uniref:NAD(P)H-binding protein n=1 Tax=Pediococcus pentosaceus TaxID=1255 RepID=UPI0003C3364D|nr:NAD(P)H-binding protein [Pediococcus pentosaceus]AHA04352.1 NAD-dependent dehydratase [Pediococcus pentosaceus SL4]AXR42788.1 NAD-dependent dehydratase [Pediococcus pentosaceus]KAF0519182.1 NAD(P)H-binding protein [Pediococcus pentosaceus]KAF0523806.1 NAD(P)H-binding protein [Pediococcus pentosaceus]MBF7111454.1 NAD(P)H-binding protein [Pediococcus pentosaceus]